VSEPSRAPPRPLAEEVGFAAVLAAFLATHAVLLPSLQHLIDEGTNVYAARLIQHGQVPFRDFFYHQPPLYLYLLAWLPTDHIAWGRGLSLLATCGSGRVVFEVARGLRVGGAVGGAAAGSATGAVTPLAAVALFWFAALQYYGMLALPNACMLLFALLGAWLAVHRRQPVAGAAALVAAVLFKPIAIPVIFAVLAALAAAPARRRDALPFAAVIGAGAIASWGALHLLSGGTFTDLLRLQADRYAGRTVLDVLRAMPQLRADLEGVGSPELNLLMHVEWLTSGDLLLWVALVPGAWAAWRGTARFPREDAVLWSAWLLLCAASFLLVWDVSWTHYHLLYLPPLALFAGSWLAGLAARGPIARVAVVVLGVLFAAAGVAKLADRQRDYAPVLALRGETRPLLTFDATLNVLSRTDSPCGLLDYLAQGAPGFYGETFARFGVSSEDIVRCLDASPEIAVVIHQTSDVGLLFIDGVLWDAIRRLTAERVIYLSEASREAFLALEGRR
jgi:hypothetical protein